MNQTITILKTNNFEGVTPPNFKMYCRSIVISQCGLGNRTDIDQWNKTRSAERDHTNTAIDSDKEAKAF